MKGRFRVYQEPNDPRDIRFEVCEDSTEDIPTDQLGLRDECQAALTVIRIICPDERNFREYFNHLVSLAQAGLVGQTANPELADRALEGLKQDITAREAGRIKNGYMKKLGYCALIGVAALVVAWGGLAWCSVGLWPQELVKFEIGTMLGVWLSFGTRKPVLKFEDLHILEEDRLEPVVRLVFTGVLAGTVALLFFLHVVDVTLGALSTDQIAGNGWAALLFGILSGVGEKALATNVSHQAAILLKS
ncbi:MAG: hypothetical protein ABSG10_09650 [Terracidiphilus sp.]